MNFIKLLNILTILICLCTVAVAEQRPLYISKARFYSGINKSDNIKDLWSKVVKNLSPEEFQKLKNKPDYDFSTSEYIDGVYVPEDLQEAWFELEKSLSEEDRHRLKKIQEYEMSNFHFSTGMGMRNSWGLWKGSRLAKYFNEIGIHHPDDMSSIILRTFWCYINNKPLKLEQRISLYKEFWAVRIPPPLHTYPEQNLKEVGEQSYHTDKGSYLGHIFVYTNPNSGKIWLFENGKGWEVATKSFYKKFPAWKNKKRPTTKK